MVANRPHNRASGATRGTIVNGRRATAPEKEEVMISVTALRRAAFATVLSVGLGVSLYASAARAADAAPTDEEILNAKCSLCHDAHRIYRITPEQIRPIVERMRKLNPD